MFWVPSSGTSCLPAAAALLLLLAIGVFPEAAYAKRITHEGRETSSANSSLAPVLDEGDSWKCDDISFQLGRKLGQGQWGAVFRSADGRYAVKIELRANTADKFWHMKDLAHECGVMRDLASVINVPSCWGHCIKDGHQILVMELVPDARDMYQVSSRMDEYDMHKIAEQVYTSVTRMLSADVMNVDQDAKNILVGPDSDVYFIDMGMAERPKEVETMLSDASYAKKYGVLREFAALGMGPAIAYQIALENRGTASSSLGCLPSQSPEAMEGLVDAFCVDPHRELVADMYYRVSASQKDRLFLAAFKGEYKWGDKVAEKWLEKQGDGFVKLDDRPFKTTNAQSNKAEEHDIPKGAVLFGVKCENDSEMVDLSDFDPTSYADDLCNGWYYFKLENVQYIASVIIDMLERGGSKTQQLKAKAVACRDSF